MFTRALQKQGEKGATLVLFTVLLASFILPGVGLAIDGAVAFVVRAKLSAAVDAAALAGVQALGSGADLSQQAQNADRAAAAYFYANFSAGQMNAQPSLQRPISPIYGTGFRTLSLKATAQTPTYFLRVLGIASINVAASSRATRRNVNLMVVLDRSGSMTRSNSCEPMKTAAQNFTAKFANGSDDLGLITFMGSAHLEYAPQTNFRTPGPSYNANLSDTIGMIQCKGANGSTGTAQALSMALQQFTDYGLFNPSALNIVLLFTDGDPDAVGASFSITNSACLPDVTSRIVNGFIQNIDQKNGTFKTAGVYDSAGQPVSATTDQQLSDSTGCNFPHNKYDAYKDVASIPGVDLWGNSTAGYAGLNPTNAQDSTQLRQAALNTADNAANKIRNAGIAIYTIGEGTAIDAQATEFLQRVSNLAPYTNSDPKQPVGFYVYAPGPGQLAGAFNTIASQIFRLSN